MAVIVQQSLVCADSMHPCFHVQGDIHHRILCRAREKAGLHLHGLWLQKPPIKWLLSSAEMAPDPAFMS